MPGKTATHHWISMYCLPSLSIPPHDQRWLYPKAEEAEGWILVLGSSRVEPEEGSERSEVTHCSVAGGAG